MHASVFVPLFAATESNLPLGLGLLLIPLLIVINGYFVAAEFALVAIRRTRVEELVNQNVPRAKSLLEAVTELDRSVAAAQLGITVASLALGLVSEPALYQLVSPLFRNLPEHWEGPIQHTASVLLTLSLITYMHVVFGEQMPKIAALQSNERIGLWVSGPLNLFARFTKPLIRLMNGSSSRFLRWFGYRATDSHGEIYTVDELRLLVEDTEEAGLIDTDAAEYVMNVFELSNKKVRDVMVPWEKVSALELRTPPDKILEAVRDGAHTRMPVYDTNPNNIVGVVNTKDLFFLFSVKGAVILVDALYEAQFVAPDEPVSKALTTFKRSKRPLAVVKDTAGAVLGILTLEDVLEEIVGDIEDEHDDPRRKARLRRMLKKTTRIAPPFPARNRKGDSPPSRPLED
jgi:CBS domain containing-hemolysin-like protein